MTPSLTPTLTETPTASPTWIETLVATITGTDAPLVVPTLKPDDALTATPGATPTFPAMPGIELTPALAFPSPEALALDLEPEQPLPVLESTDFRDPHDVDWEFTEPVMEPSADGTYWLHFRTPYAVRARLPDQNNVTLTLNLRMSGGRVSIRTHYTEGIGYYRFSLSADGLLELARGETLYLVNDSVPWVNVNWLEIEVSGNVSCPQNQSSCVNGLTARYYDSFSTQYTIGSGVNPVVGAPPLVTQIDPFISYGYGGTLDQNWSIRPAGINPDQFAVVWEGSVIIRQTGIYRFVTYADDGVLLWVGSQRTQSPPFTPDVENWASQPRTRKLGNLCMSLTAGTLVPIRMAYFESGFGESVELRWEINGIEQAQAIPNADLTTEIATTNPQLQPCTNLTPSPTPTPLTLADYGVVTQGSWTSTELSEILASANTIGQAFARQVLNQFGTVVEPHLIFKEVMGVDQYGAITLIRVTNGQVICFADNNVRTITCGDLQNSNGSSRPITQYVITHEFGHVFDNEGARGGNKTLRDYVADTRLGATNPNCVHVRSSNRCEILDSQGDVVMGVVNCPVLGGTAWIRGERGWGSGPGSTYSAADSCSFSTRLFSNFQQNPQPNGTALDENQEAAADMFLNWVYDAFQNTSWSPSEPNSGPPYCNTISGGCNDSARNPGTARRDWMNEVIRRIFTARGWQ